MDVVANMAAEADHPTSTTSDSSYELIPRYPLTDPQKIFHYTDLQRSKPTRANDPYEYLAGWGNKHQVCHFSYFKNIFLGCQT